jgi:Flp pilus assembly protein TadD
MTIDEAIRLALQLHQAGKLDEAEALYRQILATAPDYPDALNLLGALQHQKGNHRQAVELIGRAIDLAPATAEFHMNLGLALAAERRTEEAISAYRRSLELKPNNAGIWHDLGTALQSLDRLDEAIAGFRRAVELSPEHAEAVNALGSALSDAGESAEAIRLLRRCIALRPDFAAAHLNLGVALLRQGDFREGWPEYQWRWRIPNLYLSPRKFPTPPWEGQFLPGKRIALHIEQGVGDAIQFIRYAPMVAERCGKVVFYGPGELFRMLGTADGIHECVDWNQPLVYDAHCSLLSLPPVFKTDLGSIPAKVPYLSVEPEVRRRWKEHLAGDGRLKVGLSWAGRPEHGRDRQRSIALEQLAPLSEIPKVRLISVQKGSPAEQVRTATFEVMDTTGRLADFADTAGLIENLDLVVCVDSAVAHLAGALGKPTWLLLPHAPDWRWMRDRADSPWYPTMRLFRQKTAGDWAPPIREAAESLRTL